MIWARHLQDYESIICNFLIKLHNTSESRILVSPISEGRLLVSSTSFLQTHKYPPWNHYYPAFHEEAYSFPDGVWYHLRSPWSYYISIHTGGSQNAEPNSKGFFCSIKALEYRAGTILIIGKWIVSGTQWAGCISESLCQATEMNADCYVILFLVAFRVTLWHPTGDLGDKKAHYASEYVEVSQLHPSNGWNLSLGCWVSVPRTGHLTPRSTDILDCISRTLCLIIDG